ncbi:MAG: helix-turn-helix transcriptional regulator [Candidatus Omnitrophica bacterium]|nr:helix-turn-helix transcriptional regulator [Candidatus Omnitrophota bacterium]
MKVNWLWDTKLSEARVKKILRNENDPRFYIYAEKLFSRMNNPQEAFDYVPKKVFCKRWPALKKRIEKDAWAKGRADFWQTIYERVHLQKIPLERLSIAGQIKNLRTKLGYTQKEMAQRLGVIQQYVAKLEAGRENLTLDTLKRIAEVLGKQLTVQLR